eukprot:7384406-Prymnesium_polylepis.3
MLNRRATRRRACSESSPISSTQPRQMPGSLTGERQLAAHLERLPQVGASVGSAQRKAVARLNGVWTPVRMASRLTNRSRASETVRGKVTHAVQSAQCEQPEFE